MSQYIRVPQQALLSYSDEQVLGIAQRDSLNSCQAWADADPNCHLYNYNHATQTCTKLQTLHDYNVVLGVRLNSQFSCPYGKFATSPFLIFPASDFNFVQDHPIVYQKSQPTLQHCQEALQNLPQVQFFVYNVQDQSCVGYGPNAHGDNTIGIKIMQKLDTICGDRPINVSDNNVITNNTNVLPFANGYNEYSNQYTNPSAFEQIKSIFSFSNGLNPCLLVFLGLLFLLFIVWILSARSSNTDDKEQTKTTRLDYNAIHQLSDQFNPPLSMYNNPFLCTPNIT